MSEGKKSRRSRTHARTAQNRAEQRRKRQTYLTIGVVLGVVVAFTLLIIAGRPLPSVDELRYEAYQKGVNEQGFPVLGEPDAPLVLEDYSSLSCGHCRNLHRDTLPLLMENWIEEGLLTFVYKTAPAAGIYGEATEATLCAAEQDQFWPALETFFSWLGVRSYTREEVDQALENIGLDMGQYQACMDSDRPERLIALAGSEMQNLGITGTPGLVLNGRKLPSGNLPYETIVEYLNAELEQPEPEG